MGRRLAGCVAASFALASAACGGGGSGGAGGGSNVAAPSTVAARSALVSADLDGDGLADCATVARDGSGSTTALRNLGGGRYAAFETAAAGTTLRDLADACDLLDDASLTDGYAVHALERLGRSPTAWAVLHVGDGAAATVGAPALEEVDPTSAPAGAVVALGGHDLAARGAETTVTVGGTDARVLFAFPDRVFFVVPDVAVGPAEVVLSRGGTAAAPVALEVVATPVPTVTGTAPDTAVVGRVLVVRGEHLGTPFDVVEVAFSGAAPVRALSLGPVAAVVVPEGAVSGPAVLTVDGVASAPFPVTVGTAPTPSITALVPTAASVGSLVRIEGRDLLPIGERLEVTVGGARAAVFALRPGAVTVVVPPAALDGDVVVTVGGRASPGAPFDVLARGAPRVDAVDPTTVAPFAVVDVRGTDLVDLSAWVAGARPPRPPLGDLAVTVGGVGAWFVLPTVEGLRVVVPPDAVSGDLVVTVDGVASNPVPLTVR